MKKNRINGHLLTLMLLTSACYHVEEPSDESAQDIPQEFIKEVQQALPSTTCPGGAGPHPYITIPMKLDVMELPRDSYNINENGDKSREAFPNYGNNTRFIYDHYMNSSFANINFRFKYFNTEEHHPATGESADTFSFYATYPHYPPTTNLQLKATLSGAAKSIYMTLFTNSQYYQNRVRMTWNASNKRSNDIGWYLERADVQCGTAIGGQLSSPIYNNYPVFGLLAQTNDYIYFNVPYDNTKTHFVHLRHLAGLSTAGGTGYDFDFYVKRGYGGTPIYPGPGNSDFTGSKSISNNTPLDEMVRIPTTSTGFNRLWIAVRSYNGKGHFQLNANKVISERVLETHIGTLLGLNATATARLKAMSRALYAATEGQVWVKEFKVYANQDDCTGFHCQVYIKPLPDASGYCHTPWYEDNYIEIDSHINMTTFTTGTTFSHEVGHCWYGYLTMEEYVTASNIFKDRSTCGHSAMGGSDSDNWEGSIDFCKYNNHGKDPHGVAPDDVSPPGASGSSLWSGYLSPNGIPITHFISSAGENSTPDPYDYYQKDPFNTDPDAQHQRNTDILFAPFVTITTH